VKSLCFELGNIELYHLLFPSPEGELNNATIIDRLMSLESFGCRCENEIEFAASLFFSLTSSSLVKLSVSMLSMIVSHDSLRLKSEDSFYDFISSAISLDSTYCSLLDSIRYEYLSQSSMSAFLQQISHSFELLTPSVWSRLIDGVLLVENIRVAEREFKYREESPFGGIIAFLTWKCGGNVCDHGVVSVTSSSIYSGRVANHTVDFNGLSHLQTKNSGNSWICYDFHVLRAKVSHYSIRSRNDDNIHHPKSWILEGSMDGNNWIELDCQKDRNELVGLSRSATFPTSRSQFVQMIRIRQHGRIAAALIIWL
jgi:hypothetical protein